MRYTLYHIKGVKWGMTERLEARLKQQGYTISDCCEFEYYDDENIAADREKELNIKCGYGWNKQQDWRIAKKNSYKGGAKAKELKAGFYGKKHTLESKKKTSSSTRG